MTPPDVPAAQAAVHPYLHTHPDAVVPAPGRQRARLIGWVVYDWAYSPFNTLVTTFVFATYFVRAVAHDVAAGTAGWAFAQSVAGILIALLAAPLGAMADRGGLRAQMLLLCTLVLAGCTASLWFVRPDAAWATTALVLVAAATVAYEVGLSFYNAMLLEVAPPGRMGRVSGLAWGAGYGGGLAALVICLLVLIEPSVPPFGLDRAQAEPVRAAMPFAAGWLLLFGLPLPLLAWDRPAHRRSIQAAVRRGMASLRVTVRGVLRNPPLRLYLLARMLYSDGLTVLFAFGAIYAAGTFGMNTHDVMLLGIGLNITAGLGAFAFSLVEDRIGAKTVVMASLLCLIVLGAALLVVRSVAWFWVLAVPLGLFIGPAQSASRCLMARFAPARRRNALFGLYALSGRVTGFAGPAALAAVTAATGSQRAGMGVVLVFLIAGAVLLASVPAVQAASSSPARLARRNT